MDQNHHGKGFASEALKCICDWAFTNPELQIIRANTLHLPEGLASQKVLFNVGFTYESEDEKEMHFILSRPDK